MAMIAFAVERFLACYEEAKPLLEMHWRELARNQDTIALEPDAFRYTQLCGSGNLLIVTARDAGELVGYVTFVIAKQLHYRSTLWAEGDIYWLRPDLRGKGHGEAMMAFAERELRERGVTVLHVRDKIAHPAAGRMWQRMGFEPIETVYERLLK